MPARQGSLQDSRLGVRRPTSRLRGATDPVAQFFWTPDHKEHRPLIIEPKSESSTQSAIKRVERRRRDIYGRQSRQRIIDGLASGRSIESVGSELDVVTGDGEPATDRSPTLTHVGGDAPGTVIHG